MTTYAIFYHNDKGQVYQKDFLKSVEAYIERITDIELNKPHLRITRYVVINGEYIKV